MTRDQLIETMARASAESTNGGKFGEDQWYTEDHRKLWITRATAALTAIEAAGMRVVPVEPSEKMIQAGQFAVSDKPGNGDATDGYRAMILAAQEDSTSET